MAAQNQHGPGRPDEEGESRGGLQLDSLAPDSAERTLRALAFWSAVVLPFLHLPLLAAGLTSPGERHAFVGLFALNALALYVGHSHGPG